MFSKILIANRGEIALRIIRACQEMGIKTVAVYSSADANSLHVRLADESVCIGNAPATESYLKMNNIISAADITGADAIHPGVGFLSENATFATMVEEHGMTFIGPSAQHIEIMADKISAKKAIKECSIPTVPGSLEKITAIEQAHKIANSIKYPILIKAACGGGGRGMQIAFEESQLESLVKMAQLEAKAGFGDESVFFERYLQKPRHIEVQILADKYGNVVHLGERDCSIQRRHQKIWEEAPSPAITDKNREKLGQLCVEAIKHLGYSTVGTLEFLYENGKFYFIEMNTRIQVEHPITEMITGIDLVKEQIRMAAGEKLTIKQEDISFEGHSIECRINAENAETFTPSPGEIKFYHPPSGMGVRVDSHLYYGYQIPPYYDSLVSKLIVHGKNREDALNRLRRSIREYVIDGISTLLPLHLKLVDNPDIQSGMYDIHWLEEFINNENVKEATA